MIETLPYWAQIGFWILILVFSHFLAFAWGDAFAKKFWKGLLDNCRTKARERAIRDADKVALLTDGLGGTCNRCKGFGVTGEDGQYECMACSGTGVRDLSGLAEQNEAIIKRAITDCDTTKKKLQTLLPTKEQDQLDV